MANDATVARLTEAGLELPSTPVAVGAYVPATRAGNFVFTSGQLPTRAGALLVSGLVGDDITLDEAQLCARQCALNVLAAAATVCNLDEVVRVVKLVGYVASASGFTAQPAVMNGSSDVMIAAFGDAGVHAREAVGVAALPLGAPVELSAVFEVR